MASSSRQVADIYGGTVVYDAIVVGAGVIGSATAWQCVKRGFNTLLIEQFGLPHSRGSSHGQSRIIRYSYDQSHYSAMMSEAYPMWAELEQETNTKLYHKTGLLTISMHPKGTLYHNSVHQMRKYGRAHRLLDHDALKREYPELDLPPSALVFLDYDGGTLRADKALQAFQTAFEKRGGHLRDEEPVVEILPGTIVTVRTNRGQYRTKNLMVTPGAWAPKLLGKIGLAPPLDVVRINVPYWKEKQPGWMSKLPNIIIECDEHSHTYGLQSLEYPGFTKVAYHGGSDKIDPDYRDKVAPGKKEEVEYLKQFVGKHLPRLENELAIMETCMYTRTPDEELIIDRHPIYPNIQVCAGCSGHGFKLAPSIGKILYRLASGQESHIDIKALSFKRFKNSSLTNSSKM